MNILITGGAGYIGTELTNRLNIDDKIESITIYDNLSKGNRNLFIGHPKLSNKVKFISGDLLDSRTLKKALIGIDTVYHLAAKVSTPFSDQGSHEFEQINNWGTAELVYAIEESNVKTLVYLSSVSVYGASTDIVEVGSNPNPQTFYGISKLRGEGHIKRLSDKITTYILRCGNVYGYSKSMRFDAVINKFMFEANYNKKIAVNGDGLQFRSFININKVSEILHQLSNGKLPSDIYHLTQYNLSVVEIVDELKELYPELEMLFVNQHMKQKEIRVTSDDRINQLITLKTSFKQELTEFKERFTF